MSSPPTATSAQAADKTLTLAHDLATRLPGTAAALHAGIITLYKARIIADATHLLNPAEAAAAETRALREVAWQDPRAAAGGERAGRDRRQPRRGTGPPGKSPARRPGGVVA
jgi:Domain of unknown function (DUF222)